MTSDPPATADTTTDGEAETRALGAALAGHLAAGDVVLLVGELGAGKTTFVRGVAEALGVVGPVTSPTFSIAQRYEATTALAHLDAYRLSDPDDEEFGLALEVIGEDAIAFIEWPDALAAALPPARLVVRLEHGGGDRRLLAFTTTDRALGVALADLVADARLRHLNPGPEPRAPRGT